MICNKCGKQNEIGNKFCNYCGGDIIAGSDTNTPLAGADRLKIGWLFAILILPFGGFGMAVIPIVILWSSIYIMKKDKSFQAIINAKKYIKIYLTLLSIVWIIGLSIAYYEDNKEVYNEKYSYEPIPNPAYTVMINPAYKLIKNPDYDIGIKRAKHLYGNDVCDYYPLLCPQDKYISNGEPEYIGNGEPQFLPEEPMYIPNKKIIIEVFGVVIASAAGFSMIGAIIMFIFNFLFFNVMERNKAWVVGNGIFTDAEKTFSDLVCTNCGGKLKNTGSFCPHCGHKG